jgi:hypothetical protein
VFDTAGAVMDDDVLSAFIHVLDRAVTVMDHDVLSTFADVFESLVTVMNYVHVRAAFVDVLHVPGAVINAAGSKMDARGY